MCEQLVHVPLVAWRPDQQSNQRVDAPISLTALSYMALNGDQIADTETPVVATSDGLNGTNRIERAAHYLTPTELDPFFGEIRVSYEVTEGRIRKHVAHGDNRVTYELNNGWSRIDESTAERIDAAFGEFEDAGVAATDREVTTDTRSRLRNLGYI
jgi:hypothetical protein